ncbi:protein arginine methyltransferase NDUFAF7, mitochondrial isoform X2 [Lithobates pipiens]
MMNGFVRLKYFGRTVTHVRSVFAARNGGRYQSSKIENSQDGNPLLKYLTMKIKATGPFTVAEYMREVLTNPLKLIGIWCVSEWISGGKSKSLNLVELGPGRGSLMGDILRVFNQFQYLLNACDISIHLVEVSPKLSEIQALNLTKKSTEAKDEDTSSCYKIGITKTGLPINWYYHIQDVPSGYTFYIAHEFFDALPIHKFQKVQDEWREILIDVDPEIPQKLRFVLGSSCSPIAKTFVQADEKRNHVEVCPEAAIIIQKLANQLKKYGGAALIADYGHSGDKEDTFRGFRSHQLHNVLVDPGTADLTADVDFNFLKMMIGNTVSSFGPIAQHEFLRNMGIDLRLKVLMENAKDHTMQTHLMQSYDVLMNPDKMGKRFQFFSIFPHGRLEQTSKNKYPLAGFTELEMS